MKTTTGCEVAGSHSVELASCMPSTLRANSITAICGGVVVVMWKGG